MGIIINFLPQSTIVMFLCPFVLYTKVELRHFHRLECCLDFNLVIYFFRCLQDKNVYGYTVYTFL